MVTEVSRSRRALTLAAGAAALSGSWIAPARAAATRTPSAIASSGVKPKPSWVAAVT